MDGQTKELTIARTFNASVNEVFRAWTDPAILAKWWGPMGVTNPECEVDPKVGGKIRVVMLAGEELGPMAGQRWPMEGEFIEIEENKKLVFKNCAVDEQGKTLIEGQTTVIFEAKDGKTSLTMTTVAKGVSADSAPMLDGMTAGWTQSIDKLESLFP